MGPTERHLVSIGRSPSATGFASGARLRDAEGASRLTTTGRGSPGARGELRRTDRTPPSERAARI